MYYVLEWWAIAMSISMNPLVNVDLVGLGNLGAAIANLIAANGYEVLGWEYSDQVVAEINSTHTNARFLPGVALNPRLVATSNLEGVFEQCEIVLIALPSAFLRKTLEPFQTRVRPATLLVNLAKGIERSTGLTSFQMLSTLFLSNPKVMLSGPSIANEF